MNTITKVVHYRNSTLASQVADIAEDVCDFELKGVQLKLIGTPDEIHLVLLEASHQGIEGVSIN